MNLSIEKRIIGCLKGIATGDAIGKQTEMLSHEEVCKWYPGGIHGFEGVPGNIIPRYVGNKKHEWRIGETTDDTENTIAVAKAIIKYGNIRHADVGKELLNSRKCIHPGVESLWELHQSGDPARVDLHHNGCGAAIRVAPVGILYSMDELEKIIDGVREASISTHGGKTAIAAAVATASAVSSAVDGASPGEIISFALYAVENYESGFNGSCNALFTESFKRILEDLKKCKVFTPASVADKYFPDNVLKIVPLAIVLGVMMESAEDAILLATNIGGDSDSVASIAGGILGARFPDTVNDKWYSVIERINNHDLITLAQGLSTFR